MTEINGMSGELHMNQPSKIGNMDRFISSDTDENGTVSKDEFLANAPEDVSVSKLDEVFARMDADGNGEVTAEEHQIMADEMSSRMKNMSKPEDDSSYTNFDTFKSMLESLASKEEDSGKASDIEDLLATLEEQGYDKQSMSRTMATVNNMYPKVDITV